VHYIDPISQPEFPPPPPFTPAQEPVAQGDPAKVDLLDVLLIVAVAFVALLVTSFATLGIYWLNHKGEHLTPDAMSKGLSNNALYLVALQLAAYLIIVGFMALLAWGRHKVTLGQAISWNAPATARQVWYALAGGLALAAISDIGNFVLNPWIPKSLPITELFKDRPSALMLAAFGILIAPLVEEIAFRGFLYPALARVTGALPSIIVTAALFTLLHGAQLSFSWAPLLLIFIVGFTLTTVRARTNSVALCVIVHMTYNFALLAQTFAVTHGFRQMQGG
jgi:membrane protease YdiL (CAAX protease family)